MNEACGPSTRFMHPFKATIHGLTLARTLVATAIEKPCFWPKNRYGPRINILLRLVFGNLGNKPLLSSGIVSILT